MKLVRIGAGDTQAIMAVYKFLSGLRYKYNDFRKWYYDTVIPGLDSGERLIYAVTDDGKIVAILILKSASEKKICTLRVAEDYRNQGIATELLKIACQKLRCSTPLITVSSYHIAEFESLLKKNGFILYAKYPNYYKQGVSEFAFNGYLSENQ